MLSNARAEVISNIDIDTYNQNYDYTMTRLAGNMAIPSTYECDEVYSNLLNKYGTSDESYCKVETIDGKKFYCFGLSYTGSSAEASLPECANIYCDSSEYAVWKQAYAAVGQEFYGCAKYFPNSNCWEHGGDTEVSVNPSQYSNIITNYKSMNDGALECDFNRRARPSTNGNCANPNLGELLQCYCAYDESYYVSGNEAPNENGQITILCAPCPAYADCNGQRDRFRCRAGYYDYDPNLSGRGANCVPCPSASSNIIDFCDTQPTSPNGATSITQCYLPTGTMCKDVYGTFSIVNRNCYYLN